MDELKPCVLLSIQPKWCEKIASGEKTVEIRKTKPKIEPPFKCYIYETKGKTDTPFMDEDGHLDFHGRGQVIGEFICDDIICAGLGNYRIFKTSDTQIDPLDLLDYADDKRVYGWHISHLVIYDKPKGLGNFNHCGDNYHFNPPVMKPPQSWCYVEKLEVEEDG